MQSEVVDRVRGTFDVDRVTKRFHERYQREHAAFLPFIQGITPWEDRAWYTSVMLNRLMFLYFVQRQGLLDGDRHYLRNRWDRRRQERGNGPYSSFYRHFLCRFFHEGLACPKQSRPAGLEALLGNVPYLQGGLFDPHVLEVAYPELDIADDAFGRIFDVFDSYQWRLDDRPLTAENQINPDILGYVFEKNVNQKQMGAYYTKGDITEYIARNTIVPFLLDASGLGCSAGFPNAGPVQWLLARDPDRYLFSALRQGTDKALPLEVARGLDDVTQRTLWNRAATKAQGLPTETWREQIARREHAEEIRKKLKTGDVTDLNDLVTFNLDVRQLAADILAGCDDPAILRAFWTALRDLSVLDPTCGSGAFLLAALEVLEPLYESCLMRLETLLWETETPGELDDFRRTLEDLKSHPSRRFFILKSILVNNLYGVDVMKEATEVCKLRLLLKIIAQARSAADLELLPDLDSNIRVGNALVGFATLTEVETMRKGRLDFSPQDRLRVQGAVKLAEDAWANFRSLTTPGGTHDDGLSAKALLQLRRENLREELDRFLAPEYGVDADRKSYFDEWYSHHHPFHWFAEMYGVMAKGGFDVILGNPPYVEYSKVRDDYTVKNFATEDCGNLYAYVVERSLALLGPRGRSGMIVPHSAFCTDRMAPLLRLFDRPQTTWISTYDIRPSKLFVGVDQRLAIYLTAPAKQKQTYGTRYHRWQESARPHLLTTLRYTPVGSMVYSGAVAKAGDRVEQSLWEKLQGRLPLRNHLHGPARIYYHNAPRYWVRALTFAPYFWNERDGDKLSTQVKTLPVPSCRDGAVIVAALNSSLFYWWFLVFSDSRHLNLREIERFPLGLSALGTQAQAKLETLCARLMEDYQRHAVRKECRYKTTGNVIYDEFYPRRSKAILDQIDTVLAEPMGFTDRERDYLINYDLKYRFGTEDEPE